MGGGRTVLLGLNLLTLAACGAGPDVAASAAGTFADVSTCSDLPSRLFSAGANAADATEQDRLWIDAQTRMAELGCDVQTVVDATDALAPPRPEVGWCASVGAAPALPDDIRNQLQLLVGLPGASVYIDMAQDRAELALTIDSVRHFEHGPEYADTELFTDAVELWSSFANTCRQAGHPTAQ